MNDDHRPRLFATDEAIRHIGEGLLARTLPKHEWTHEAHLAATCWLIVDRPYIAIDQRLPDIIRRYNESVGGVNDEAQGYHETITRCFLAGTRLHLAGIDPAWSLVEKVNSLLQSANGRRDWPLRFYSRERLFSGKARLSWIEPNLRPLPFPGERTDAKVGG